MRLWSTENSVAADIVSDAKDMKRVDCLKTGAPSSRIYMTGIHSDDDGSSSSSEGGSGGHQPNYEDEEEEAMEDED